MKFAALTALVASVVSAGFSDDTLLMLNKKHDNLDTIKDDDDDVNDDQIDNDHDT